RSSGRCSVMAPRFATMNSQWAPRSRYPQPQAIQTQKTTHLELMEALLAKGADVNARIKKQPWYFAYNNCGNPNCGLETIDGTTPFWRATYALDLDAMRLLIKHGADAKLASIPPAPAAATARPAPPPSPAPTRSSRRSRLPRPRVRPVRLGRVRPRTVAARLPQKPTPRSPT